MEEILLSTINLELPAVLEAILFVASGPVTPAQLAAALGISEADVELALGQLEKSLQDNRAMRGLSLQKHKGRVQLTTVPEAAVVIERFLGLETTSRLSRAALETLAIVAYQQPVTRPQIDAVRGVNSDSVLKNLLSKGMIGELGRSEAVGRPILYGTTPDFLQYFGLSSLEALPALRLEKPNLSQDADSQGV